MICRSSRPWLELLAITAAIAALGYGLALAGAAFKAQAAGDRIGLDLLAQWPVDGLAYWYVPVLLAIYAVEIAHLGWRQSPLWRIVNGSPSARTDAFYLAAELFGVGPLLVVAASLGLGLVLEETGSLAPAWRPAAELPLALGVVVYFLADSFLTYWSHRLMHSRWLWPFHAIHHAAEDVSAITTTRHHPIDSLFGALASAVPAALLGLDADAILIGSLAAGTATTFLHTRLPIPVWIEKYLVAGPRVHGIHHSAHPEDHDSNFSLFTPWDRLFGTYRWHERPLTFGAGSPRFDTGRPLHDLVAMYALAWAELRRSLTAGSFGRRVEIPVRSTPAPNAPLLSRSLR